MTELALRPFFFDDMFVLVCQGAFAASRWPYSSLLPMSMLLYCLGGCSGPAAMDVPGITDCRISNEESAWLRSCDDCA